MNTKEKDRMGIAIAHLQNGQINSGIAILEEMLK